MRTETTIGYICLFTALFFYQTQGAESYTGRYFNLIAMPLFIVSMYKDYKEWKKNKKK